MADVAEKRMTVAEFLTWDDGTDTRYELIDGRPVAMAPSAPSHSIVAANLSGALGGKPLSYYAGATAGVIPPDRDDTFYLADLVVSCTPVAPGMAVIPAPVVVIEALSPSTVEHDRGRKAYDYRCVPSVREIILVASEQRHVEIWRRRGTKWEVEDLIGDATLELETVGIKVPFAKIYADSGI
jgi:Uma2 family endonuclease